MKRNWELEELIEHFTIMPNEMSLIGNKSGETRLGFIVLLKFFQFEARFPDSKHEIEKVIIEYIAKQIQVKSTLFERYDMNSRTYYNHKAQIRDFFGFRESTNEDANNITKWLSKRTIYKDTNTATLKEIIYNKFRESHIEPPSLDRVNRIAKSAMYSYEKQFFQETYSKLSNESITIMDSLIVNLSAYESNEIDCNDKNVHLSFSDLRSDPGRIGLESIFREIMKLKTIRQINLPDNLFNNISQKVIKKYKQRVASEDLRELRRHPEPLRYTLLSAFFWLRCREITDNLIELLIQIIHRIGVRAERKVEKEFINDFKRVNGKTNILFKMADAALNNPDGIVKEVLFPIVNENTLTSLVKEFKNTGSAYKKKVYTLMRLSYANHYRRMVPEILDILEFRSNNEVHKPIIKALEIIRKYYNIGTHYFSNTEIIPIDGVIKPGMKDAVIEKDDNGQERINRMNYEIVTLQTLRDKLRCKEIWVIGADRYRNPDEDLPIDFENRREEHYKALKQPLNSEAFISSIKDAMYNGLTKLDIGMPKNPKVRLSIKNNKGWITVSPSDPQPEPVNLMKLKSEVMRQWPMTNLLDILKESDLRISFTDSFKTMAAHERLDRDTIQKRLILALYGLGTNTGLKRVSAGNHGENYKDLLYIRKKFINKDNLRNAISSIVNAILKNRVEDIWGEATTTCASDSKKFGAWDQNLMTEWHIRYRGRGVMIYWHVEKNSTCVYSQLKTCSSSEVSAMIEGLLKHCTDMEIEKNFVDSHGQSEVAFAFSHLLGFNLMPRLKAIYKQKLYRPDTGISDAFPNLQPILTRPINWELIRQQYDQMIKYATALRLGTAETEAILKRFTRNNLKHPTYQALCELGKAIKTIFLCEYLNSESLRIEINEGLNVVENWNSANSFIFYGKGGEICTNRLEDQEISVLSLHLLQNCLVYINTLMIQQILSQKKWYEMMTSEDFRALTPLIYTHVNPYGNFDLDMSQRIPIDAYTA
ncbi:Tn3 family transposase [Tepidibacter formicigenes]|jgi:TnpA family transposase|uniref:Transposase and inactivated derivatives, TnpA family n=1 Tax=Tepidibacter formicigenes DSM 15518 TaxID=1123349 RepID=A0A1M6SC21_9FIRM|nr:Tn3 family transposase [Tepidibacter formicigenes]SHK42077.1 Transposase and inactivated derivatives, TnpA family [Tepidibacter formicigenes DSM 15518]